MRRRYHAKTRPGRAVQCEVLTGLLLLPGVRDFILANPFTAIVLIALAIAASLAGVMWVVGHLLAWVGLLLGQSITVPGELREPGAEEHLEEGRAAP